SDAESASDFIRANAVLTIGNHPNSDQPLIESERGVFEDSSNFCAELLPSVLRLALPEVASSEKTNLFPPASWALDSVRPAALYDEREAILWLGVVNDGLLQSLWLFHGVSHWPKYRRKPLLSQVYYCPCAWAGSGKTPRKTSNTTLPKRRR